MNFGDTLKRLRKEAGYSQQDFADALARHDTEGRFSQTTVPAFEQRELPPRGEIMQIICDVLGVNYAMFMDVNPHDAIMQAFGQLAACDSAVVIKLAEFTQKYQPTVRDIDRMIVFHVLSNGVQEFEVVE